MPLRLHFLRHGQTAGSRENVFCGRGLDIDLTPEGEEMARQFAAFYAGTRWRAVYASPLRRAQATAAPTAAAAGLTVATLDGLAEIDYGRWDGRTAEDVDRDFHDDYVRWTADPAWNAPTGGETAIALSQRVLAAVQTIVREQGGGEEGETDGGHEAEGDVLVVSHKAAIRVALCGLLGVDVGRFRFRFACPTASVSVVEFGRHGPMADAVADRSHLDARLRALKGT